MSYDEILAVVSAAKEKKPIQYSENGITWYDCTDRPLFDFSSRIYRIKPAPPREWWIFFNGDDPASATAYPGIYHALHERNSNRNCVHVREVIQ